MLIIGTTVSVLTRVDLVVDRPERLLRAARHLSPGSLPGGAGHADRDAGRIYASLVALVAEYGGDVLAENPGRFGLIGGDSSTVLLQGEDGDSPWQGTWPPGVDRRRIMLQLDGGMTCDVEHHLAMEAAEETEAEAEEDG
ncbi:hypothetical protein POF50_028505 [Streptomyces sp. SL13]|uniref:Uncharacterized protein n=1 Tax=Streptantibioticus silvisoli TaxID=2705255 RepID=A0AA90KBF3_9ACTN|nr:hypothetical protein [Streptantibioticus silvisoli]MDI5973242.1 hypothetical protein [Streptantibioticus silvisoli]